MGEKNKVLMQEKTLLAFSKGAKLLCDVVGITIGPCGKNVTFENFGKVTTSNDGVNIAKKVKSDSHEINYGVQLIKDAASKSNDVAGDGTTSFIVFTHALASESIKLVLSGVSPVALKDGLEIVMDSALEILEKDSKAISNNEEIKQVAAISSGDTRIGELIADAIKTIGSKGVITVDEGKSFKTEIDVVSGIQLDKGYAARFLVSGHGNESEIELDNPFVLVTDKKLSNMQEIVPILEQVMNVGKPLFIVADDVDNEVLANLAFNNVRGVFKVIVSKAPSFGEQRKLILEDVSVLTGGEFISEEKGILLKDIKDISMLGQAKKVRVSKDKSIIIDGNGSPSKIKDRMSQIESEKMAATSSYDIEKLEKRAACFSGGVARIHVGASTEAEMQKKKMQVEDSLNATKAAIAGGVVAGGGVAYINVARELKGFKLEKEEHNIALSLFVRSLEAVLRKIAENADVDAGVVVDTVLKSKKGVGFNAITKQYVDMFSDGIIDPTIVVASVLRHSVSVVGTMITTGVLLIEEKDENKAVAPSVPSY